jgi:hypothetical protein
VTFSKPWSSGDQHLLSQQSRFPYLWKHWQGPALFWSWCSLLASYSKVFHFFLIVKQDLNHIGIHFISQSSRYILSFYLPHSVAKDSEHSPMHDPGSIYPSHCTSWIAVWQAQCSKPAWIVQPSTLTHLHTHTLCPVTKVTHTEGLCHYLCHILICSTLNIWFLHPQVNHHWRMEDGTQKNGCGSQSGSMCGDSETPSHQGWVELISVVAARIGGVSGSIRTLLDTNSGYYLSNCPHIVRSLEEKVENTAVQVKGCQRSFLCLPSS